MAVNIFRRLWQFLFIYLATGMLSGMSHVLLAPAMPAVGASGAVMGIFGAVAAGIWRLKDRLPRGIRRQELSWMFGLALSQVVLDHFSPARCFDGTPWRFVLWLSNWSFVAAQAKIQTHSCRLSRLACHFLVSTIILRLSGRSRLSPLLASFRL